MFRRPIGDRFYLWSVDTEADICVLSSHGCYLPWKGEFTVPDGMEILFYCMEGKAINSGRTSIRDLVASKGSRAVEVLEAGAVCKNYSISKYQGYNRYPIAVAFGVLVKPFLLYRLHHEMNQISPRNGRDIKDVALRALSNSLETYQTLEEDMLQLQSLLGMQASGSRVRCDGLEPMDSIPDIITVRHRVGRIATDLGSLINAIQRERPQYKKLCFFSCREHLLDLLPSCRRSNQVAPD